MAVAGAFALAAAFCALYGLLSMVVDEPWAAAITALTFAVVFGAFALTHKPPARKRSSHGDDAPGEHPNSLSGAAGLAAHLPAQLMEIAKRHPAAALGVGAVAALIVLRRPALMLMAATHLLGRRKKTPWERARDLLPF